jgi:FKBP-type peptidyl-prolyl cis-trans isomerase FkpA
MTKRLRKIAFAIMILIYPLVFISCLKTEDVPDRTAAMEQQEIDEVLDNLITKGYNVDTTTLGSFYVMNKTGEGEYPKAGDTINIIYTGFYLDGGIFDASYYHYTDSIWEFVYKSQSLISGFDEAISLLNKGAEADFIIPSKLAYGESGYSEIPAYSPLGFSIKMKNIKAKN